MGNSLPFRKKTKEVYKELSDKASSVEAAASVPPSSAESLRLDRGPHPPTAAILLTSTPANVLTSVAEPKDISYQDEMKTLEAADRLQELRVEAEVSVVPIKEQASISPTTEVVGEDSSGTGHSTRTGADGSGGASKIGHSTRTEGDDGSGETGHSTRTEGDDGSGETGQSTKIKKKHRRTHKRQHGESAY